MQPELIVMGASWGGVSALEWLLGHLPEDVRVPIAIAQHRGEGSADYLPHVLQRVSSRAVRDASDKEEIRPGVVYLAPAGYHLLVDRGEFALSVDERVNFARPSIDVLFESAAEAYQQQLIAVLLTGTGRDGAAGLRSAQQMGGTTVVQDPATAHRPEMPRAALALMEPTWIVPLDRIPALLSDLCRLRVRRGP